MKQIIKHIFTFLALIVFFSSCSDEFDFNRRTDLLTQKAWRVKTIINYSQNETTEFRNADYIFYKDLTLIKIYENSDTVTTSWKLSSDGQYITIGSNTFRITEITSRVMSLRYGEVEIFFVPIK